MLVGGAAVRPNICPQPTTGATVRLVCTLSSPLPGVGLTVEWCGLCLGYLHTASLWCCFDGIWRISWGGSARCTGAGEADSARFAFGGPLREGPCGTGREADLSHGWIYRSTVLVICTVQASSVRELVPFGILAGGWLREMALAIAFVHRQAELCLLGLNNSPSHCPLAFPLSEQSC